MQKDLILFALKAVNIHFRRHCSCSPNAADTFPVTCESCLEGMGQVINCISLDYYNYLNLFDMSNSLYFVQIMDFILLSSKARGNLV